MILAMFTIVGISFLWTQYNNPGIRKLAGVKQLLRNAADEMTLVLTDVESTQALSQWNPAVCHSVPGCQASHSGLFSLGLYATKLHCSMPELCPMMTGTSIDVTAAQLLRVLPRPALGWSAVQPKNLPSIQRCR